ncbi:TPA: hypothetical protein WM899_001283 [Neisseria gonorrhoeae]
METIEKKVFRDCLLYYLDCKYWAYEQLQGMYFERWCKRVNKEKYVTEDIEVLTKNDHLLNWFANQWEAYVEGEIAKYYGQSLMEGVFDREDVELMIELFVEDIFKVYPKTILQIIKSEKRKIIVQ